MIKNICLFVRQIAPSQARIFAMSYALENTKTPKH